MKRAIRDTQKDKELFLVLLQKHLGLVTPTCKEMKMNRGTFYDWCKSDPAFKAAVTDIDEVTLDFVEGKLLENVGNNDNVAITFYMKYKARQRGYNDRLDITTNGKDITEIKLIHINGKDAGNKDD